MWTAGDEFPREAKAPARRLKARVVVLVVGLALTACAGADGEGEARDYRVPELASVPVVDAAVRLPFQQYELPRADRQRMQEGQARLLTSCMAERGFEVSIAGDYVLGNQQAGAMDPTMWGGPFGTMEIAHARRFGYKPSRDGSFVKGPGFYHSNPAHLFVETGRLSESETAQVEAAYYGSDGADEVAGCERQVDQRIDVPLVDLLDLSADLNQLAREHPRVVATSQRWSRCMALAGFPYTEVWGASQRFSTSPISEEQIATAVADIRCTRKSHWADYFYAAVADYQRQAIEREPDLLSGALAAEKARLAAIEAELARGE